jgi:hypothetical protein
MKFNHQLGWTNASHSPLNSQFLCQSFPVEFLACAAAHFSVKINLHKIIFCEFKFLSDNKIIFYFFSTCVDKLEINFTANWQITLQSKKSC